MPALARPAARLVPGLAIAVSVACVPARATVVSLSADIDVLSYSTSPRNTQQDAFLAPTTAAWNATGRSGSAAVGPVTSTLFPNERHEAGVAYAQPGIVGTLTGYVRISGYYYNPNTPNAVSASATLSSSISVFNPTGTTVRLIAGHRVHGFVAAGGTANSSSASASETLIIANSNFGTHTFSGAATVTYRGTPGVDTPVFQTSGDWAGFATQTTYALPGFSDPLAALEIARGYFIEIGLLAGATTTINIISKTLYSVYSTDSSFLSAGVDDFTHTSDLDLYAEDPATGERLPQVTFTFEDDAVVPEPTAVLAAAPLAALVTRRRQRR